MLPGRPLVCPWYPAVGCTWIVRPLVMPVEKSSENGGVLIVQTGMMLMAVILIVEDDMLICELAGMMMQDCGYCIHSASDVDEALELLRSPRKIDALFTDIYLKMAVYGGCELAQQAILLRPSLRVLYTTGNAITDKLKSLFVDGALFLRKPYTVNQLQQSMAQALAV